jgi:hypothetical protein
MLRRIRKTFMNGAHVALVGEEVDLTYPAEYLGDSPDALGALLKGGKDKEGLLNRLKGAKKPAVIVGPGVLNRPDRDAVLQQARMAGPAARKQGVCMSALQRMPPAGLQHACVVMCTELSLPCWDDGHLISCIHCAAA